MLHYRYLHNVQPPLHTPIYPCRCYDALSCSRDKATTSCILCPAYEAGPVAQSSSPYVLAGIKNVNTPPASLISPAISAIGQNNHCLILR